MKYIFADLLNQCSLQWINGSISEMISSISFWKRKESPHLTNAPSARTTQSLSVQTASGHHHIAGNVFWKLIGTLHFISHSYGLRHTIPLCPCSPWDLPFALDMVAHHVQRQLRYVYIEYINAWPCSQTCRESKLHRLPSSVGGPIRIDTLGLPFCNLYWRKPQTLWTPRLSFQHLRIHLSPSPNHPTQLHRTPCLQLWI